jgi:hypothetical protein
MSLAAEFDAVVAELPDDWAFFECYVAVADPTRLTDARVALGRANARPIRGHANANHDFEVTVAHRWGHGCLAGVMRTALRILDDLGVEGRVWAGATYDLLRPAPAHRYGP